ncbi:DUF423 domain-containing protein [Fodinisporobacter ferrooxydans]|uniref:DUF423 domain-containing protein n=1 Tax=Fodinisporobacter ferrooxydans TaxID=2901836 RepID=A0ABY4CUL2_9BACL|nr:DUF423 domain-containing protein [Alicyclobacillaceae bacterium MYW30-H2]
MDKTFIVLGSLLLFLGVAFGAFGAHILKSKLSADMLNVFETGVHYHMIHALGLLLVALFADKFPHAGVWIGWSGWSLFAGILLFSGSLYALSITGIRMLGIITPFGGVAFLIGWICLAVAALKGGA